MTIQDIIDHVEASPPGGPYRFSTGRWRSAQTVYDRLTEPHSVRVPLVEARDFKDLVVPSDWERLNETDLLWVTALLSGGLYSDGPAWQLLISYFPDTAHIHHDLSAEGRVFTQSESQFLWGRDVTLDEVGQAKEQADFVASPPSEG